MNTNLPLNPRSMLVLVFFMCFLEINFTAKAESSGFVLMNADNGDRLGDLTGQLFGTVHLSEYPFNLTVIIDPEFIQGMDNIKSVVFYYDHKKARTEHVAPYAIGGDVQGVFHPFSFTKGMHAFKARLYDQPRGKGNLLLELEVTANFIEGPTIVSFTVVNADTDEDILTTQESSISLNYADLHSPFNVRASTVPDHIGSVVFRYYTSHNRRWVHRTENARPYALFGDTNGDYHGQTITEDITYFITATPYSKSHGRGTAGPAVTFEINIYGVPNAAAARAVYENDGDAFYENNSFKAFPNPFSTQTTLTFTIEERNSVTLEVYDFQGTKVKTLYAGNPEALETLSFDLSSEGLPDGLYLCRLVRGNALSTRKLFLRR